MAGQARFSSATPARWAAMPPRRLVGVEQGVDQVIADLRRAGADQLAGAPRACRRRQRMPRPNSALSSNSEFDQAGPRPSAFFAQGVVGRLPP
jgi:hypothetical protein